MNQQQQKHCLSTDQWRSQNAEKVAQIKRRLLYQEMILYDYLPFQEMILYDYVPFQNRNFS